jgi:nucleotide-binding universal stress UspA family protein
VTGDPTLHSVFLDGRTQMLTKHDGIIVRVDGSPASDFAVGWAAHEAAMRGESLTLMRVENPAGPTWSQAVQSARRPVIVARPSR